MTDKHLFPIAIAINTFSITALLVIAGILGFSDVASDIAVIQGATLVFFLAFSANSRNIILGSNNNDIVKQSFLMRATLLLPLAVGAYHLSFMLFDVSVLLAVVLIIRRSVDWLVDLHISNAERNNDITRIYAYIFSQIAVLLLVVAGLFISKEYFYFMLIIWALSPLYLTSSFVIRMLSEVTVRDVPAFNEFIPHVGSSMIIAISTYVFRVIIVLLAGKLIAGQLFSAFAVGGMLSSIYTQAIGPSLIFHKSRNEFKGGEFILTVFVALMLFLGCGIAILPYILDTIPSDKLLFISAIGLSLIGGAIMIMAQRIKTQKMQIDKESVFVPDVLSNVLLIGIMPFSYYLVGPEMLSALFLLSAILSYVFYKLPLRCQ